MWILLNESSDDGFYDDSSINETAEKLSVYTGQPKLLLSGCACFRGSEQSWI